MQTRKGLRAFLFLARPVLSDLTISNSYIVYGVLPELHNIFGVLMKHSQYLVKIEINWLNLESNVVSP